MFKWFGSWRKGKEVVSGAESGYDLVGEMYNLGGFHEATRELENIPPDLDRELLCRNAFQRITSGVIKPAVIEPTMQLAIVAVRNFELLRDESSRRSPKRGTTGVLLQKEMKRSSNPIGLLARKVIEHPQSYDADSVFMLLRHRADWEKSRKTVKDAMGESLSSVIRLSSAYPPHYIQVRHESGAIEIHEDILERELYSDNTPLSLYLRGHSWVAQVEEASKNSGFLLRLGSGGGLPKLRQAFDWMPDRAGGYILLRKSNDYSWQASRFERLGVDVLMGRIHGFVEELSIKHKSEFVISPRTQSFLDMFPPAPRLDEVELMLALERIGAEKSRVRLRTTDW